MRFSMSTAWNDATALMSANREVLAIVSGVFFLLPSLALAVLFADQQAQAMAMLQQMLAGGTLDPASAPTLQSMPGSFLAISMVAYLIQLVGYMALLAIMDDRRRPTVGEAIGTAFKCLIPLIGLVLVFIIGYIVCALVVGLLMAAIIAGAAAVSAGLAGALSVIMIFAVFVAVFWVMVRLSLTLAELVLGGKLNPISAYAGSWRMTKGNGFRLFLFYLLLFIVYIVISMLLVSVLLAASAATPTSVGGIVMGLISALVGAAFAIVISAIIAATYRQLAGPSAAAVSATFE